MVGKIEIENTKQKKIKSRLKQMPIKYLQFQNQPRVIIKIH